MQGLLAAAAAGDEAAQALLARLSMGSGGVGRGPGSAPLTFGEEQPELRDRFKVGALPKGSLPDFENSGLVGLSATAPTVEVLEQAGGNGAFGTEGTQTSFTRRVAPRHRDAVRDFFDTKTKAPAEARTKD